MDVKILLIFFFYFSNASIVRYSSKDPQTLVIPVVPPYSLGQNFRKSMVHGLWILDRHDIQVINGTISRKSYDCIWNSDFCKADDTCCHGKPGEKPCVSEDEMSFYVGLGVGTQFCDYEMYTFYGEMNEIRLHCGNTIVNGIEVRHGPRQGSNLTRWTDIHGGWTADSRTVHWDIDGRMMTDINVYHNGRYITGLQGKGLIKCHVQPKCSTRRVPNKGFYAERGSPTRYLFETCGNMEGDSRPSTVLINQQSTESPHNYNERCRLAYIAGSAMDVPNEQINSMSFYFVCDENFE